MLHLYSVVTTKLTRGHFIIIYSNLETSTLPFTVGDLSREILTRFSEYSQLLNS